MRGGASGTHPIVWLCRVEGKNPEWEDRQGVGGRWGVVGPFLALHHLGNGSRAKIHQAEKRTKEHKRAGVGKKGSTTWGLGVFQREEGPDRLIAMGGRTTTKGGRDRVRGADIFLGEPATGVRTQ